MGCLSPQAFHSYYESLARATTVAAVPTFVWGQAKPHLCLGQAQSAIAELAPDHGEVTVQRKLGGGAVWIDENQYCVVAIISCQKLPLWPAEWFDALLAPMQATFRSFGLEVEQRDRDLWLQGRKIAGSGAATIGEAAVIASSFLIDFPRARFANCIASPSVGFNRWLEDALRLSMTSWCEHQARPEMGTIKRAFAEALGAVYGATVDFSAVEPAASDFQDTSAGVETEADSASMSAKRLVPHGIKLNAGTFLTERIFEGFSVRVLTEHGKIARLAWSDREVRLAEPLRLDPHPIASQLSHAGVADSKLWAERVMQTAFSGG